MPIILYERWNAQCDICYHWYVEHGDFMGSLPQFKADLRSNTWKIHRKKIYCPQCMESHQKELAKTFKLRRNK